MLTAVAAIFMNPPFKDEMKEWDCSFSIGGLALEFNRQMHPIETRQGQRDADNGHLTNPPVAPIDINTYKKLL
jgi:hypothetical protein